MQLCYGRDYTFNSDGYDLITATKAEGDKIEIYEYESTDANYIPPTPTKLGLYPKYTPEKIVDNTYLVDTTIIIGHDGSKTVAYNDYRDDLILELEKRIYNNIKVTHEELNVKDFIQNIEIQSLQKAN